MGFSRQEYWSELPLPSPKVSLYSSQASAFNSPIKLPLLSFPMIPLPGLWTLHYSFRYWTLLPRHWAPSPPFRDPALHFSFYFSVSFAPLRRLVEYELPQCHPGLQPSQFIPTQGPLSHCRLPTSTTPAECWLLSSDLPLGLHITVHHPCVPPLSGSINSHHSGPIETFLFLRSQIQAISKHCRFLILLFLAPCPSLSYCWLSSGPHSQKQSKLKNSAMVTGCSLCSRKEASLLIFHPIPHLLTEEFIC